MVNYSHASLLNANTESQNLQRTVLEHTVLADRINRMCDLITGDETIFLLQHMPKAKRLQIDKQILLHSIEAVLLCGPVKCGDIVWLRIGMVGRVLRFWQSEGLPHINVQISELARCNANEPEEFYSDCVGASKFVDANDIIDACMWAEKRHGVIKVIAPFGARTL